MRGMTLRKGCYFKQFAVRQRAMMNVADLKITFCDRSGLVKCNRFDTRQCLHKVRSLDQDTLIASSADAAEEAQRNADNDSTWAADDKECERAVDPLRPDRIKTHEESNDWRDDCKRERTVANCRSIDSRELCDELLGFGLSGACIFNQIKDLRSC